MPYDDDFWTSMGTPATPPAPSPATPAEPPPPLVAAPVAGSPPGWAPPPVPIEGPVAPTPSGWRPPVNPYEGLTADNFPMPTGTSARPSYYRGTALFAAVAGLLLVSLMAWFFHSAGSGIAQSQQGVSDVFTKLYVEQTGMAAEAYRARFGRYGSVEEIQRYAEIGDRPGIALTVVRADETSLCLRARNKSRKVTYYYATGRGLLDAGQTCS